MDVRYRVVVWCGFRGVIGSEVGVDGQTLVVVLPTMGPPALAYLTSDARSPKRAKNCG